MTRTITAGSNRSPRVESGPATLLTADGHALIEERIRDIRDRRLAELRPLLVDQDRDERDVAAFEALLAQAATYEALLAQSQVVAPEANPQAVRLGTWVLLEFSDGTSAWVRPVDPGEAFLDDERISCASPLGQAIMGAAAGTRVQVQAPSGHWDAVIVQIRGTVPAPQAS